VSQGPAEPPGADAERFDAIVIGAGAGGLTVAIGLARIGRRVALVEGGEVGGDCTNVGCIPSKTLLDLAARLRAGGLAPGSDAWAAAAAAALAEVRRRRDALRAHESEMLATEPRLELVRGRGRLTAAGGVEIDIAGGGARRLRSPRVVLATGARPLRIDLPGLPPDRVWTHRDVFEAAAPPSHLAVLGGGPIGVELATAFARLGSRVTLVEALPRLLPAGEPEASAVVADALRRLGVDVRLGVRATGFEAAGGTLALAPADGAAGGGAGAAGDPAAGLDAAPNAAVSGVDRVLLALGRRPAIDGLTTVPGGLEALGIRVGRQGIVTDAAHRTTRRGVYAIGDVSAARGGGERAKFTHAANAQGRRLVRHLTLPWLPLTPEGDYPAVTFGDPEVAQVGPPLAALRERVHPAAIVSQRVDLADLDRGLTLGLREGFVLLHARRFSGRLLSATVVGPHAGELIQLLTWAQRRRLTLWQLSRHVVAYPTLAEGIKRAADAFVFATLPALPRELGVYLRTRWRRPPADAPATHAVARDR
jgi:pyruvate/2-oxoglutarate dehydrogenase complex dihydrolipoamide dehydrogenase (E3) component